MNQPEARIARVIRHVIWVGITAHAGFIPVFAWLGYPLLAGFNVFGVICWAAAGLTNRRGHCTVAMWLLTGEVTLHAVVAAQALEWASGFQYYLIPLIPFVMFNERLRARVALGVGVLLVSRARCGEQYPVHLACLSGGRLEVTASMAPIDGWAQLTLRYALHANRLQCRKAGRLR